MKKALCIGLNYSRSSNKLPSCIADAEKIKALLLRNQDNSKNFDVKLLTDNETDITTEVLKRNIDNLFKENSEDMDLILLYFSGHGYLNEHGGYLITNNSSQYSEGVEMEWILNCLTHSKARNKVVILDSCYSGQFGNSTIRNSNTHLPNGVTILTSSRPCEVSYANGGGSVFTELLSFALEGEAKNIFGEITASSIYSYIDVSLGSFDQRPIFKTNISKSVVLRKTTPKVDIEILREVLQYFPSIDYKYKLDQQYEIETKKKRILEAYPHLDPDLKPDTEKVAKFKKIQILNKEGLIKPSKEEYMFFAAINSDTCELTPIGKHYWRLVKKERI